ncbi:Smr/MutS family protein [Mesorhizobium sp. J18]|uniref:Smr/MutS family protein n=1 Tax=Mesorhizobium sp. J18 TaxID=935263 RepID=UPI0032B16448
MPSKIQGATAGNPPAGPKSMADPKHLDRPTKDKLAKGRLQIGATVDLHGLTQAEAYNLLLSFLHRAHAAGLRYVLVITGKGSSAGGDGILRRLVPVWLATAGFREIVGGFDRASRHHGGDGAIYVRLRRARKKA